MTSKAFAPANISCIFKVYEHKNPRWMGSYGVGFTINEGVVVSVHDAKRNEVVFNSSSISFPTVADVIKMLTGRKIRVYITAKLPLGCGFGLSGASALATSYAINNHLKLGKGAKELAIMAHTAEVQNKTGLGDVVNQYFGGFCMKLQPSSYFKVKKLPIKNADVYCRYFSKLSTKSIITNKAMKIKINEPATKALDRVKKSKKINFEQVIKISKDFSRESGLLKDRKAIDTINMIEKNKGNASMIMLGNAVFSDKPFKDSLKFKIVDKGAHLI